MRFVTRRRTRLNSNSNTRPGTCGCWFVTTAPGSIRTYCNPDATDTGDSPECENARKASGRGFVCGVARVRERKWSCRFRVTSRLSQRRKTVGAVGFAADCQRVTVTDQEVTNEQQ